MIGRIMSEMGGWKSEITRKDNSEEEGMNT